MKLRQYTVPDKYYNVTDLCSVGYAEVGLEPDHRKDSTIWVELTFCVVEYIYDNC